MPRRCLAQRLANREKRDRRGCESSAPKCAHNKSRGNSSTEIQSWRLKPVQIQQGAATNAGIEAHSRRRRNTDGKRHRAQKTALPIRNGDKKMEKPHARGPWRICMVRAWVDVDGYGYKSGDPLIGSASTCRTPDIGFT